METETADVSIISSDMNPLLDRLSIKAQSSSFDGYKHDKESRFHITKSFLKWYFILIAGSFMFCLFYNDTAAYINHKWLINMRPLEYLDVANTVAIITTTLSSALGFVIGYYFKGKEERH